MGRSMSGGLNPIQKTIGSQGMLREGKIIFPNEVYNNCLWDTKQSGNDTTSIIQIEQHLYLCVCVSLCVCV